jgi:glycosyltransferase involved in cell wall biosynthesis
MTEVETPRVSVLMPAYNHERFVEKAVRSVWDQTANDIELIVIDDGSTDETPEILRSLAAVSPIPMAVTMQPNAGISTTLNRALDQAKGRWVSILASDDYYGPNFIKRNLEVAERHGRDDITQHSDAFLIEHDDSITGILGQVSQVAPLHGEEFERIATKSGRLLPSSMFLPRQLFEGIGGFDPQLIAEDYDVHLRLARVGQFEFIDEPLVYSRYTPGSLGKQPWVWGQCIIDSIVKHKDILGDRLPQILSDRAARIALTCFEYGRWGAGMHWAKRSVAYARGGRAKLQAFNRTTLSMTHGIARGIAYRVFGRDLLVRMKRWLAG